MARPQITEFGIGNFRAFDSYQSTPLRPITLLFGPNNAGKSSFARGLALASHLLEVRWSGDVDTVEDLHSVADRPDVGGFDTYIHDNAKPLIMSFAVPISAVRFGAPSGSDSDGEAAESWFLLLQAVLSDLCAFRLVYSYDLNRPEFGYPSPGPPDANTSSEWDWLHRSTQLQVEISSGQWEGARETVGPQIFEGLRARFPDRLGSKKEVESAKKEFLTKASPWRLAQHLRDGSPWPALLAPGDTSRDICDFLLDEFKHDGVFGSDIDLPRHLRAHAEFALALLTHLADSTVAREAGRIRSIGPLRSIPPRIGNPVDSGGSGGTAWSRLVEEPDMREQVGDWLSRLSGGRNRLGLRLGIIGPDLPPSATTIEELSGELLPLIERLVERYRLKAEADPTLRHNDAGDIDSGDVARRWAERLHKSQGSENRLSIRLVEGDGKRTRAIRDTGLGMSQLIPVVVELLGNTERTIVIEQPEVHLHPAIQAELGDLLIEAALGRRQSMVIAETHSEHLLLRIMRRIRETSEGRIPPHEIGVRPEDVSLVFFERVDDVPVARYIELDERGMITRPWPGGFFEEGFREVFA